MRTLLFVLLIVFVNGFTFANNPVLSEKAEISLLTCQPGKELHSFFGHSAIRIKDPANRIDLVYNYGTFSFNTPNFYLKFIRGYLNYQLAVAPYHVFMREYIYHKRSVFEQILDLSPYQKQKLYSFVEKNALPENKYYLYDFFFDNCATRIRDVLPAVLGDTISFDLNMADEGKTFRELIDSYLEANHWTHLGINIVLGIPTDKKADALKLMFLPDYLKEAFLRAELYDKYKKKKLISKQHYLFKPKTVKENQNIRVTPSLVFLILLIVALVLTFLEYKKKRYFKIIDIIAFSISGLIGLLVTFLWFFTDHTAVVNNLNIVWAFPLNIVFVFYIIRKHIAKPVKLYLHFFAGINILLLMFFWLLPQEIDLRLVPFILILILRSFYNCYIKQTSN